MTTTVAQVSNDNELVKAFPIFALLKEGKIVNIAFGLDVKADDNIAKTMRANMIRIGTLHAIDAFVNIHKGYHHTKDPESKQYVANEKAKWYALTKKEESTYSIDLPSYRLFMGLDREGYEFVIENGKHVINEKGFPAVEKITRVKSMDLIPAEHKLDIEQKLKFRMAMPCTIQTSRPDKLYITFYARNNKRVFIQPAKKYTDPTKLQWNPEAKEAALTEQLNSEIEDHTQDNLDQWKDVPVASEMAF
jgi:hypothetical protein